MSMATNTELQIQHRVAIAGILTDEITQQPIPFAEIRLLQAPQKLTERLALKALQLSNQWQLRPGGDRIWISSHRSLAIVHTAKGDYCLQTWTDQNGCFAFLDLQDDGDYTLQASWPEAGSRYGLVSFTVTSWKQADSTARFVELKLPPTALQGKVSKSDGPAISMAKVQIQETGDFTFTDKDGKYLFTGLEASSPKASSKEASPKKWTVCVVNVDPILIAVPILIDVPWIVVAEVELQQGATKILDLKIP